MKIDESILKKTVSLMVAWCFIAGSLLVLMPSGLSSAETLNEETMNEIVENPTFEPDPIPDPLFTPPARPVFQRIYEDYNITLADMETPDGPFHEGKEGPVQVTLSNRAAHAIRNIDVKIYDSVDGAAECFLTSLFYNIIPAGKEQQRAFVWTPGAGTHSLKIMISYKDGGAQQVNEEAFGFYVMNKNTEPAPSSSPLIVPYGETLILTGEYMHDDHIEVYGTLILDDCNLVILCEDDNQFQITVWHSGRMEILGDSLITATQRWGTNFGFIVHGALEMRGTAPVYDSNGYMIQEAIRPTVQWMYGNPEDATVPGGIQMHDLSAGTFEWASVKQSRSHNIYADNAAILVSDTIVSGAQSQGIGCGIYAINGASPKVECGEFSGNGHSGIYVDGGYPMLSDFKAAGNYVGVMLENVGTGINQMLEPEYVPGTDMGYFIWLDDEGYHVHMVSDGQDHYFTATIQTDDGDTTFSQWVSAGEESFRTIPHSEWISFDVKIDGEYRPDATFFGAGLTVSETLPVSMLLPPTIRAPEIIMANDVGQYGIYAIESSPYICDAPMITAIDYGIIVEGGSPVIANNLIADTHYHGLFVEHGTPAILNNHMYHNANAMNCGWIAQILVKECDGVIDGNIVEGSTPLDDSADDDFTINAEPPITLDHLETGILADTSSTVIQNNVVFDHHKVGIILFDYHGTVSSNDVSSSSAGIRALWGSSSHLAQNSVDHCSVGIEVYQCTDENVITGNIVSQCYFGIVVAESSMTNVIQNIVDLSSHGIHVQEASNVDISLNDVSYCTYGLDFVESWATTVTMNNVHHNMDGISLTGESELWISSNNVHTNDNYGISVVGFTLAGSGYIRDNIVETNLMVGIFIYVSHINMSPLLLSDNNINNNVRGVEVIESNVMISGGSITDNGVMGNYGGDDGDSTGIYASASILSISTVTFQNNRGSVVFTDGSLGYMESCSVYETGLPAYPGAEYYPRSYGVKVESSVANIFQCTFQECAPAIDVISGSEVQITECVFDGSGTFTNKEDDLIGIRCLSGSSISVASSSLVGCRIAIQLDLGASAEILDSAIDQSQAYGVMSRLTPLQISNTAITNTQGIVNTLPVAESWALSVNNEGDMSMPLMIDLGTYISDNIGGAMIVGSQPTVMGCTLSDNALVGLELVECTGASIEGSYVERNLDDGIRASFTSLIVNNCEVNENIGSGIYLEYCSGQVTNSRISENYQPVYNPPPEQMFTGIDIKSCQNVYVYQNTITYNRVGVYLLDSIMINLDSNTFEEYSAVPQVTPGFPAPKAVYSVNSHMNAYRNMVYGTVYGFQVLNANSGLQTRIRWNEFQRLDANMAPEAGVFLENSPNVWVDANTFNALRYGVTCREYSNSLVTNNVFDSCEVAIHILESDPVVEGNVITGSRVGIESHWGSPTIGGLDTNQYNTISGCTEFAIVSYGIRPANHDNVGSYLLLVNTITGNAVSVAHYWALDITVLQNENPLTETYLEVWDSYSSEPVLSGYTDMSGQARAYVLWAAWIEDSNGVTDLYQPNPYWVCVYPETGPSEWWSDEIWVDSNTAVTIIVP